MKSNETQPLTGLGLGNANCQYSCDMKKNGTWEKDCNESIKVSCYFINTETNILSVFKEGGNKTRAHKTL